MCAILDANVVHEVFGVARPPAGEGFFNWLNSGGGRLVVGGRLREELNQSSQAYREWAQQARLSGDLKRLDDPEEMEVNTKTEVLEQGAALKSNDPHVIALAQVSGSRLLYSNDSDLQDDFKDRRLINNPRGKVYSTLVNDQFTSDRRRQLVARAKLCQSDR